MRALSNLRDQPVHHLLVLVRLFGVAGGVVVSRAARKVSGLGMHRARQSPPADRVAIHIAVARKAAQPVEVFLGQHLAAVLRLLRIVKRLGHPVVHSQVKIASAQTPASANARSNQTPRSRTRSTPSHCPATAQCAWCRRAKGRPSRANPPARCAWACPSRAPSAAHRRSRRAISA